MLDEFIASYNQLEPDQDVDVLVNQIPLSQHDRGTHMGRDEPDLDVHRASLRFQVRTQDQFR